MARLVQRAPKYLPEEWRHSNKLKYSSAEKERQIAERIRDETNRLVVETDQTTVKTQSDVDKKLDQRLTDVSYWKAELDRQHVETNGEIENLLKFKARLEQAIVDTEIPLKVASDCLVIREERVKIDNVHDDVEVQLLKVRKGRRERGGGGCQCVKSSRGVDVKSASPSPLVTMTLKVPPTQSGDPA